MIDKNKIEQAAKEYADNLRPIAGLDKFDAPYLTAFDHHSDIEESFKAGVEFAEKEMYSEIVNFVSKLLESIKIDENKIKDYNQTIESKIKQIKSQFIKEKNNERSKP